MRFPLDHIEGCTPINPCLSCQAMNLIKSRLDAREMTEFTNLVGRAYKLGTSREKVGILNARIDEVFDFSGRTANALKNDGIVTVEQLQQKTEEDLLLLPNFGRRSLNEVRNALREHELFLKPRKSL